MMRSNSFVFADPIAVAESGGTDCAETGPARASGSSATGIRKYLLIMQNGDNTANVHLNWIHSGLHLLYTAAASKSFGIVKVSMAMVYAEQFRELVFPPDRETL